jgi:RNA polymerase sigma-70 factor (ECF subfamily)
MSESDLVTRAQGGDLAAFESLYRTHESRIYGLCLRMVADPTRAEDLTQESFVRAWEKLGSFRGKSAFSTWLHRLTVNVVLANIRSRGRRKDDINASDELYAVPDPRPRKEPSSRIDLDRAIKTLPAKARMVFVLHDVEGYRHQEIGEIMGIAVGTSKAHLHRARGILREALQS